ncbi:TetR/AcrR family transcriptional regulator [Mycolicibacterium austroafricanum]|uniref:TetR/AcrR family transcriptional regulator n=1 Tax=Mycolicibacterium austroafricanum TaxID=39687 RepID=UPI0009FBC365|nr:TetR/AcrR family transcriptional regulator [Mycolicibacterium austroafricanum]
MSSRRRAGSAAASASAQKPSLRETQKELTRNRVIEAALEVFEERDFASTTMDDIAVRANLNRGTIYLHFESKAEILKGAMQGMEPDEFELFKEFGAAKSRPELEVTYDHVLTLWSQIGKIWRHARDAAATDETLREWTEGVFNRQVRKVRQVFEARGMSAGSAEVRATLVVSMWSEFMTRWAANPSPRKRKATVAALADILEAVQSVRK